MKISIAAWILVAALPVAPALAQSDVESLRRGKALFLDRQYAESRGQFQAVRASARGADAQAARYWIARCSENLGEHERALSEYGAFLDSEPVDRTLAQEARTSRVALAVKLAKAGKPQHLPLARAGLADPSRAVRHFAALQLASLGPQQGREAVPVLKEILAKEADEDLVARAKLGLLRLDPKALTATSPAGTNRESAWIRVRIYEKGAPNPRVSVNLPIALAELVFKSLPADTKRELQLKGYDADTFWQRLKATGPADILTVEGGDGERVQVWIE